MSILFACPPSQTEPGKACRTFSQKISIFYYSIIEGNVKMKKMTKKQKKGLTLEIKGDNINKRRRYATEFFT